MQQTYHLICTMYGFRDNIAIYEIQSQLTQQIIWYTDNFKAPQEDGFQHF